MKARLVGGCLILLLNGFVPLHAQDLDLETLVNEQVSRQTPERSLPHPFYTLWGHSAPTVRTLPAGILDFRVSHNFGKLAGGFATVFGMTYVTDVQIALSYGITDRITIGAGTYRGTWVASRNVNVRGWWWLLQQGTEFPVHITLHLSGAYSLGNVDPYALRGGEVPPSLRWTAFASVLIARQFGQDVTVQIFPIYIYSLRGPLSHPGHFWGLGGILRVRLTPILAMVVESGWVFNPPEPRYAYPPVSAGITLLTGGHVFSLRFTNARNLLEQLMYAYTYENLADVRFAFSISRAFRIGSPFVYRGEK